MKPSCRNYGECIGRHMGSAPRPWTGITTWNSLRGHTFRNTRAIVKGAVEALDVVRFGTDESDDVD